MGAGAPNVDIVVDGNEIPDSNFISYVVDRDMYQPDMAAIVLSNQNDIYSGKFNIGATIEIKAGDKSDSLFKGEVIGLEGIYKGGDTTKIVIRAMNRMHRLLRKRKSVTFTNKSDQQILTQVVGDAGLNIEWKHQTSITYKHVYQHNQTDLEFLRTRAARMGCHVWCVDTTIYVKEPDFGTSSGLELSVDEGGTLRGFTPRLNSAGVVNKVTVKGWNPETKELIVGDATVSGSQLGSQTSVAGSGSLGNEETFVVDHPIWSKEEATAIAKARLRDLNLGYITGEAECQGNAKADLGTTIKITASAQKAQDPFNGKYYVMGVTHRHTMPKSKDGGFVTIYKLARDGQKL